jgi:5-formyltetrahydrofolate cyclo-ligase
LDKADARRHLRRLRARLARIDPAAAQAAAEHCPAALLASPLVVAGYHASGSELDPRPTLARWLAAGARLALPRAASRDSPLTFLAYHPGDPLTPDAFGVPSPDPGAARLRPDIVLAPLLAFDRRGGRLGQGGGCYDRTLRALRAQGPVLVVGLAYAGQEVANTPTDPHDEPLDAILTEKAYIEVV